MCDVYNKQASQPNQRRS